MYDVNADVGYGSLLKDKLVAKKIDKVNKLKICNVNVAKETSVVIFLTESS